MNISEIIVALIGAGSAIIVGQLSLKKALREKDIEEALRMQRMEDRIDQVEKQTEQNKKVLEKLNTIENTVIALQKDIQYMKEMK